MMIVRIATLYNPRSDDWHYC